MHSHEFVVVDGTDATISLGADFFEAYHAYTDIVRQSLVTNGKEINLLVESKHFPNTEISLKRSPDKSTLLPKGRVAQETSSKLSTGKR